MSECKCDLRTKLVGDGCRYCNPQEYIDKLIESLEELIEALEEPRKPLTDEEIADAVQDAGLEWHYAWTLNDEESSRLTKFARAIEEAHGIKGEA